MSYCLTVIFNLSLAFYVILSVHFSGFSFIDTLLLCLSYILKHTQIKLFHIKRYSIDTNWVIFNLQNTKSLSVFFSFFDFSLYNNLVVGNAVKPIKSTQFKTQILV